MRPPAERHFLALKAREGRTPGRDKAVPANRVRQGSGTQRSRASSQRGKMSRLVACVPTTVWCMRKVHQIRWGESELGVNRAERPWDA
jgi:hypothetical protein